MQQAQTDAQQTKKILVKLWPDVEKALDKHRKKTGAQLQLIVDDALRLKLGLGPRKI
jgi:hypothetical protein